MKYTIISIDDSRAECKDKIRSEMAGVEEVFVDCLDARPLTVSLVDELGKVGLHFADHWKSFYWRRGDIGGYISHYNAWRHAAESGEPLLVFEDDADLPDGFLANVETFMSEVPTDYGAVSFCVHPLLRDWYYRHIDYDEWGQPSPSNELLESSPHDYGALRMARAYQSWALTATLYSPAGAQSLVGTSQQMGVHMNADALVWHRAHAGDYDAYAPKPEYLYMTPAFNQGESTIRPLNEVR